MKPRPLLIALGVFALTFAAFLALRSPRAGELQRELAARGVLTDSRGTYLRLGPAPYLADAQLEEAVAILGSVAS